MVMRIQPAARWRKGWEELGVLFGILTPGLMAIKVTVHALGSDAFFGEKT
jgi:hypothetical protein